jgi:aminopeptidase N/puromycin-sensitive aminopeptidase
MKIGCLFRFRKQISAIFPVTLFALLLSLSCAPGLLAQRLPSTVRPENYALTLTPDLQTATFSGVESIDVRVLEPVSAITLNSAEIKFQSVSIKAAGKEQKATVALDDAKEQATFTFPEKVPAGKATLSIAYTGILNNELRGFYLSKTDRRNYAVTQFEPTDARRAFPSFDEPAFKATFDISLIADAADTAISNSPIESDTPGPAAGKHTLKFATTPKMSTYLVAFLVGDFKCTSGEQDGVAIRVCSTPDKVNLTPYGVEVAKYVMRYFNNYFGIPYPLKKLDLIAVPDFEAGAMENFGAITYRETDLLIDKKTASIDAKKQVDLVIAHEMAHQWFGDLVTMQWWDNLWLNEGFATWMENKPVAAQHQEWNIDQDVASGLDSTMNLDAQPTTRAIRAKADTPDEINQMFDGIAYGKASDVLLTVENYLGEETFRRGVHNYLTAHLYGNATAEDFWSAQTATSQKPVNRIMESLVAQPGVPLLTFEDPAAGKVALGQKRFFLSPSIKPDPTQKWTIPVCFKTSDDKQDCAVLKPAISALNVPASNFFFANAGGKGYYRSAYSPSAYDAVAAKIETALTPSERISFIGDEWAQVRSNKSPIGKYLDLVAAVKDDPNAEVVSSALSGYEAAYSEIAGSAEEKSALQAWVRATFKPVYARLGVPSDTDSPNTRELRATLFATLGGAKEPEVLAEAREIANKYIADPGSVDATFAQTAVAIAARNGDAELFDKLQKVYETSADPDIQMDALRMLAEFEDPSLVNRSLDYAISDKVRNQDAAVQFAISLGTDENREQAWKYIQAHWDKVQAQLTTNSGSTLVGSTSRFCSASERTEVEQFFSTHKVAASGQTLKHAIEHIDGCIELRSLQEPHLKTWLASNTRTSSTASTR